MGWLGPGLTQTLDTPELLAAAGVVALIAAGYADFPLIAYHFEQVATAPAV